MNALLAALSIILFSAVTLTVRGGGPAVLLCLFVALLAGIIVTRVEEQERGFLIRILVSGLLVRMLIGTLIFVSNRQEFFGGDALTYDALGGALLDAWRAGVPQPEEVMSWARSGGGWGMLYMVAGVYAIVGRNMLAVQFFNSVVGAATAPIIFLCARQIFQNLRVAKLAAFCVAFYPSLVLWSSQGLKDGPIVFLLAVVMLATLKLGERLSWKYLATLVLSMFAVLSLRFYVFYMVTAAVGGAFLIGMRPLTAQSLWRQLAIILAMGLALTYLGVLRTATSQFEAFGDLKAVQRSRADLAQQAQSGFGQDVDVSTAAGALSAIPIGITYLLFAPFPWQVANLRQSITLPEMIAWWGAFPLLIIGVWFTIKYRLRQALPIMIFTTMLTLAYSIFQGNIGTAYRQRSQILVFYFIFVAVGAVLLKERQEDRRRVTVAARQEFIKAAHAAAARQRYERWKTERERELEEIAESISQRIDF
jgi:hypothetical protein